MSQPDTSLTKRNYEILDKIYTVMPKPFYDVEANKDIRDKKMLAYAQLVIDDFNYYPPLTCYTLLDWPPALDTILVLGCQMYTTLFMMMKWTMNDFSYTDNGLSLSLDRVTKLGTAQEKFVELYKEKIKQIKHNLPIGTVVLGVPRYQNMLGQFLRATFGWNF
jgi:hypothetical protein